jgi:hypothetical protein
MTFHFLPEFAKLGKMARKPCRISHHKISRDTLENPEDQSTVFNGPNRLVPDFGFAVVLQSDDSLRFVGTIHLLRVRDHFLLKLHVFTFVHSRTGHLELHLMNLILRNFTSNLARLGTLELDQAVMTFTIRGSQNDAIGRRTEKRLLPMTNTTDILNGTRGIQLVLLLGNGLQNGSPHQRIIQEVAIARFGLGRLKLSHHDFLASGRRSVNDIPDLRSRNHRRTSIVPRIRSLIFLTVMLDDPANIAVANPVSGFLHVPSLCQLLVGLAVGCTRTTCEKGKLLHLFMNVGSGPLIGVEEETKLFHDYLWYSAGMKTHFLA